jgi:hypothetical protein
MLLFYTKSLVTNLEYRLVYVCTSRYSLPRSLDASSVDLFKPPSQIVTVKESAESYLGTRNLVKVSNSVLTAVIGVQESRRFGTGLPVLR